MAPYDGEFAGDLRWHYRQSWIGTMTELLKRISTQEQHLRQSGSPPEHSLVVRALGLERVRQELSVCSLVNPWHKLRPVALPVRRA